MRKRNGHNFEVLSERTVGDRQVRVTVQEFQFDKILKREVPVGAPKIGFGGFKKAKDFDYGIAFQAAFENAADGHEEVIAI